MVILLISLNLSQVAKVAGHSGKKEQKRETNPQPLVNDAATLPLSLLLWEMDLEQIWSGSRIKENKTKLVLKRISRPGSKELCHLKSNYAWEEGFRSHFLFRVSHSYLISDLNRLFVIEGILAKNIIHRKWLSIIVYQLQHIGRNTFIKIIFEE